MRTTFKAIAFELEASVNGPFELRCGFRLENCGIRNLKNIVIGRAADGGGGDGSGLPGLHLPLKTCLPLLHYHAATFVLRGLRAVQVALDAGLVLAC